MSTEDNTVEVDAPTQGLRTQEVSTNNSNPMATTALVLGLVSTFFNFIPLFGWLSITLATLAIIFGGVGMSKAKTLGWGKKSGATGLTLGIVNIVWFWVSIIFMTAAVVATAAV
jgi:hypothetical protein